MEEEATRWLRQAQEDIKSASILFEGERYYAASYFAQQAAEKALKAVLLLRKGTPPRRIHDLRELGEEAGVPADWLTSLTELSGTYLISRYPDLAPGNLPAHAIDYEESRAHLQLARKVLEWAQEQSQTH